MRGSHGRRPDIHDADGRIAERQAAVGGRNLEERVRKQRFIARVRTVHGGILSWQLASHPEPVIHETARQDVLDAEPAEIPGVERAQ